MGGRLGKKRRRIDAAVKGAFVDAVRRGARLEDAAAAAGCSLGGLYRARSRDGAFRDAWADALDRSSAPRLVAGGPGRAWQLRRMRHVKFTDERKRAFLDHFAGTCDAVAAAEAAGVSKSTVYNHYRGDRDFAAAWGEALAFGYARLEAEALRQRLAMQDRLRGNVDPKGEAPAEFERVMALLARYDRRGGGSGPYGPREGRMARWSFDEAIEALDKKLRALGLRNGKGGGEEAESADKQ